MKHKIEVERDPDMPGHVAISRDGAWIESLTEDEARAWGAALLDFTVNRRPAVRYYGDDDA